MLIRNEEILILLFCIPGSIHCSYWRRRERNQQNIIFRSTQIYNQTKNVWGRWYAPSWIGNFFKYVSLIIKMSSETSSTNSSQSLKTSSDMSLLSSQTSSKMSSSSLWTCHNSRTNALVLIGNDGGSEILRTTRNIFIIRLSRIRTLVLTLKWAHIFFSEKVSIFFHPKI